MLGAMAGGEALEIIVALRDLASGGFKSLETNLKHVESAANSTNLGGASKSMNTLEKDAASAGGKGGVGGLASSLIGLGGGPVTIALAALAALAAAGVALTATYDKVEQSEKDLDTAFKSHGETLEGNRVGLNKLIDSGTAYGQNAQQVRDGVLELAQAGHSWSDITASMPTILALAQAKHLDLATAARQVELAEMGNAKALKDLGIVLPKAGAASKDLATAHTGVESATTKLSAAQNALKLMEDSLAGKHKLTAAEADRLKMAHDKVTEASAALHAAQGKLTTAQDAAAKSGSAQDVVLGLLDNKLGDLFGHTTPLNKAQAELSNAWEKLATKVGPGLERMLAGIIDGFVKLVGGIIDVVTWLGKMFTAITKNNSVGIIKPTANGYGPFGVANTVSNSAVPRYASGGVVNPRAGGTLALLGEGGEREFVIPESKMGMGGSQTINFTNRTVIELDGNVVADVMERILGTRLGLRGTSGRMGV